MKEIWVNIPNYENQYLISNLGNVKSLNKIVNCGIKHNPKVEKKGKLLKLHKKKNGYMEAVLCNKGTKKYCLVHRLVAQAFIPNPNNLPQVNHKDENKENNCVENLEWCSSLYNCNYGTRNSKIYNETTFKKGHIPIFKGKK